MLREKNCAVRANGWFSLLVGEKEEQIKRIIGSHQS